MHRKRWRTTSRVALISLLASAGIIINQPVAAASPLACDSPRANHQVGLSTVNGGSQPFRIEGASATIVDGGNYVLCTIANNNGSLNFSSIWVMAQNTNGLAQSGIFYGWGDSCPHSWAEIEDSNGTHQDVNYSCTTTGSSYSYWEQTIYSGGVWRMRANVGTHVIATSTTDPNTWGSDFDATFSSETYFWNSNIPGSTARHAWHSSMQVQKYSDDSWLTTCNGNAIFGPHSSTAHRYNLGTACDSEDSWTS